MFNTSNETFAAEYRQWQEAKNKFPQNLVFINNGQKIVTFEEDADKTKFHTKLCIMGKKVAQMPKNSCLATDEFFRRLNAKIFLVNRLSC